MRIIVLFLAVFLPSMKLVAQDLNCIEWFFKSEIPSGEDCLLKCAAAPVDMSTFACNAHCETFCEFISTERQSVYTPGLTLKEIALVLNHPEKAAVVYEQKGRAERLTKKIFGRNIQGDESDAFRHFVWAALMTKDLGPEMAKEFLDAHEAHSLRDEIDRAMDLANNRAGILAAQSLREKNS